MATWTNGTNFQMYCFKINLGNQYLKYNCHPTAFTPGTFTKKLHFCRSLKNKNNYICSFSSFHISAVFTLWILFISKLRYQCFPLLTTLQSTLYDMSLNQGPMCLCLFFFLFLFVGYWSIYLTDRSRKNLENATTNLHTWCKTFFQHWIMAN